MKLYITLDLEKLEPMGDHPTEAEASYVLRKVSDMVFSADFREEYDRKLDIKDNNGRKVGQMTVAR